MFQQFSPGNEMHRVRLLIVNHAVELGGAELVLLKTLDHAPKSLFEVEVACPHEGPLTEELAKRGVLVHMGHPCRRLLGVKRKSLGAKSGAVLLYPMDFLISAIRLFLLIRRRNYDIVLTNSAKADIYGSLAGRLAGIPVVWRLHDIVSPDAFNSINLFLFGFFGKFFASRIIAISDAVARAIISRGVSEKKVSVVYNGVEIQHEISSEEREKIRSEFGLKPDTPAAALVGRLVDWKGPDVFVRACSIVARKVPDAKFLLVGDAVYGEDEYVEFLKRLTKELGLTGKVIFTGFREDVLDLLASVDCLVHASTLPEPFGLVIAEAMSAGVPVVATGAGGVPEIVEDGTTGILVPPGDHKSLAEAIAKILLDSRLGKQMGEKGKARAAQLFDIKKTSKEIFDLLMNLAEKHKRLNPDHPA